MSKKKPGNLNVREDLLDKAGQHADPAVQQMIAECRTLAALDLGTNKELFDHRNQRCEILESVLVAIIHDGVPVAGAMVAAGLPEPPPFIPDEGGLIRKDKEAGEAASRRQQGD